MLDNIVAERVEQRRRVANRGDAVGMAGFALGGRRGPGNPKPPRVASDLVGERSRRRRRGVWVADHRAGDHVEERGAVADGQRERVFGRATADGVAVLGAERHRARVGFNPKSPHADAG